MADTAKANPAQARAAVDQTPDPDEIDRTPATERASKMPSMPGTTMDPKKMIGFAAAAGAVMALPAIRNCPRSNPSPRWKPRSMIQTPSSPRH
jgi:hypothetical protein